jgi:ATP-binding cassette subfamily B (MDR/TAP) protein 1
MFEFFVAFMALFFSGQAASQMFQFSSSMSKGKNSANYLFWLHDIQPTIQGNRDNQDCAPKLGTTVQCDDLRFAYPLRPDAKVLRGIDLVVSHPVNRDAAQSADGHGTDSQRPIRRFCWRFGMR